MYQSLKYPPSCRTFFGGLGGEEKKKKKNVYILTLYFPQQSLEIGTIILSYRGRM